MAKSGLTIRIRIEGISETLRALNQLPKEANNQIREKSLKISNDLATKAQHAGIAEGSQAALVATTVKARRDRVPVVVAGGMKKLGRNRKPAFKLLFGSEFGSNRYEQFHKPHASSYWFFRTVEENSESIAREWNKAADEIVRSFSEF